MRFIMHDTKVMNIVSREYYRALMFVFLGKSAKLRQKQFRFQSRDQDFPKEMRV